MIEFKSYEEAYRYCEEESQEFGCGCGCGEYTETEYTVEGSIVYVTYSGCDMYGNYDEEVTEEWGVIVP